MNTAKWMNINWYLSRKPYDRHTSYDLFYLDICRKLFSLIRNVAANHSGQMNLNDEDCRELAYVITAYFEDEVNGIGFWQSLVQLNQQQFQKRLPFFSPALIAEQQADSDDILPADIYYLLYITLTAIVSEPDKPSFIFFDNPFFQKASEEIYEYLSGITEVETTDFYETYLVPPEDYITFKAMLDRFVYKSYLTGVEFDECLQAYVVKIKNSDISSDMRGPAVYAEKDRLLFERPSLLTAFFPVDLLAGALRCDDEKKERVRALKLRPRGLFRMQNETSDGYTFLHTATNESFHVLKRTLNNKLEVLPSGYYWLTTLAEWDGDYNISGMCLSMQFSEEKLAEYNLSHQHEFQRHYLPYREQLFKIFGEMREKTVAFFGAELLTFADGYAMQKRINEFDQWYFDSVTEGKKKDAQPAMTHLPDDLLKAKNLSLFLPHYHTMEFLTGHAKTLAILQMPNPENISYEDRDEIIELLEDKEVDAGYWLYLRQFFLLQNLSFIVRYPLGSEADLEALLRIYKPQYFSPLKLPGMTIFSSDELPVNKVQEIINKK